MLPKNIKNIQNRSRKLAVTQVNGEVFKVQSQTSVVPHKVTLTVDKDGHIHSACTCEWSRNEGVACAHTLAALNFVANKKQKSLSFWLTEGEARRQNRRVFQLMNDESQIWVTSRPMRGVN